MKISAKNIIYSFIGALVFAAAGIALRIYSLFNCFDKEIGYYATEAVLPDVFHILCVSVCVLSLASVFLLPSTKKTEYITCRKAGIFGKIGAIFAIVGSATYAMYSLVSLSDDIPPAFGPMAQTSIIKAVSLFVMIFGVLAVIYFALVFVGKTEKNDNHAILGYCVILFSLMILAKSYFDFYTTMNSPNKLLSQTTLMLCMLYMLCELRFSLGISVPRLYSGISLAAIYFTLVSSVPGIVAFCAGILNKVEYLLCDFVLLTYAIYICARYAEFALAQKKNSEVK
ncbi:MAG: hypothetical protein IKJ91_00755 [Clostridia bacterium]|nr:hypothetical protein [Clostridia bacterium]